MTSFKHFAVPTVLSSLIMAACAGSQALPPKPAAHQENQESPKIQENQDSPKIQESQNSQNGQDNTPVPDPDTIEFEADPTPMNLESLFEDFKNPKDDHDYFTLGMMLLDDVPEIQSFNPIDNVAYYSPRNKAIYYLVYRDDHPLYEFTRAPYTDTTTPNNELVIDASFKGIKLIEESAARGHGNAEHLIGLLHYYGIFQNADKRKGIELITRAAKHGVVQAQYMVGMFYELGLDRPVDKKKALQWLNKAYLNHSADAAFVLYIKYLDGIDVTQDIQKANEILRAYNTRHAWLTVADVEYKSYDDEFNDNGFNIQCFYRFDHVTPKDECCGGDEYVESMRSEEETFYADVVSRFLDFSVNYQLADQWLTAVAAQSNANNAKIILARVLASHDCKDFGDEEKLRTVETYLHSLNDNDRNFILALFYDGLYHKTRYGHGRYGDKLNYFAQKAFEYLKLSADAGNTKAQTILNKVYLNHRYNDFTPPVDINNIRNNFRDSNDADEIAKLVFDLDYQNNDHQYDAVILEFALKANLLYDMNNRYISDITTKRVKLDLIIGELYSSHKSKEYNPDKSIRYYNKIFDQIDIDAYNFYGHDEHFVSNQEFMFNKVKRALDIYQKGEGNIEANTDLALEWCRRLREIDSSKLDSTTCPQMLDKLPILNGLKPAIEDEIKKESGKDLSGFFVIKSVLNPCIEDINQCSDQLDQYYLESISKFLTAVTALTLAQQGSLDLRIIENTIHDIAITQPHDNHYKSTILAKSPVYDAIRKTNHFRSSTEMKILYTWYLRQIPYAAKAVFMKSENTKSWNEYLKQAEIEIQQNEKLKNLFGYDLLRPVQKMHR